MPARRRLHLLVLLQIAQNCAAASKVAAGTTPCSSAFPGDLKVEACGGFCKEAKSKDHCPRCQCRACPFCAPAKKGSTCASGLAGDSSTADCSDFCAAAGDAGFLPFALGERVLRAETAPVALLGALWALR